MAHQSLFEQRMRTLESAPNIFLDENQPIIIRVDGKGFHDFHKKNFGTHFSMDMQNIMNESMRFVMTKIADIEFAYTNSDEITFLMMPKPSGEYSYSGRVSKLASIIASMVTAKFNQILGHEDLAIFDARVFSVVDLPTAKEALTWRQTSGMRNAISTYAREFMSAKAMSGKSKTELESELLEMGLPIPRDGFYYGYFVSRKMPKLPAIVAHGNINEIVDVYIQENWLDLESPKDWRKSK